MIFCCLQATYDDSERTPHISDGNQSQHHFQIPGWGIRQHWWRKCSTACHHGNSEKGMGGQVVHLSLLPFTHHLPSLRVSPLSPSCLPPPHYTTISPLFYSPPTHPFQPREIVLKCWKARKFNRIMVFSGGWEWLVVLQQKYMQIRWRVQQKSSNKCWFLKYTIL